MDHSEAIKTLMSVIRRLREERNIKQGQFALNIGVNPKHYSELESGSGPSLDLKMSTFLKICHGLRVSPWRVLYLAWHNVYNFEQQDRNKRKGNGITATIK